MKKQNRVTITLSDEDFQFLNAHEELSPTGMVRMAIKEYRKKLGVEQDEEAKA